MPTKINLDAGEIYAYTAKPFSKPDIADEALSLRNIFSFGAKNNKLPKHYIINENVTVLIWEDGTKTIVRRCKDEEFNKRLGFLTAYFQKHCGLSKSKANKFLANLVTEFKEEDIKD